MKKHTLSLLFLFSILIALNIAFGIAFSSFLTTSTKPELRGHITYERTVEIHYINGTYLKPPIIGTMDQIFEYNRYVYLSYRRDSLFYEKNGGHHIEGYYYDRLFSLAILKIKENNNWVFTAVSMQISALVDGAKFLFTMNTRVNSSFVDNFRLKSNYTSPFNQFFWIEASANGYLGIMDNLQIFFVREDLDMDFSNTSHGYRVYKVPKIEQSWWNFSIRVEMKDIEFKPKGTAIYLGAHIVIHSYELIYHTNNLLLQLYLVNLVLLILFGVASLKLSRH